MRSLLFNLTIIGLVLSNCASFPKEILIDNSLRFPSKKFTVIESYSFNIGEDSTYSKYSSEVRDLSNRQLSSIKDIEGELTDKEKHRLAYLSRLLEGERILDKEGNLASSSKLVSRLSITEINELEELLQVDKSEMPQVSASCYYPRDALIFKNNGKIVGYIEMCFECTTVKFKPEIDYLIRESNYKTLLKFMKKIGHNVKEN